MRAPRRLLISVAVAAALVQGCAGGLDLPALPPTEEPGRQVVVLQVVPHRPNVDGYDRSCEKGHRCVFGPAWSDDVDVDGGHNGCDTRNDILRRDLHDVVLKPGTEGCVVLHGTLRDPYTGAVVPFDRAEATEVQIDHVYPLAAAWDFGAADWPPGRRAAFANDPRNLMATEGSVNASKGDQTPGEWMPPAGQCRYATAYREVARVYGLPVSYADAEALEQTSEQCDSAPVVTSSTTS